MAYDDKFTVNGNNYSRQYSELTILVYGAAIPITEYTKGIAYEETWDKQFDYTLGSFHASHFGVGVITSSGTLTVTDAGLNKLNVIASDNGLASFLYLGDFVKMDLEVKYTTNDGKVKTDLLENIHFTNHANGVNTDDVLYSRDISMIIGRINPGLIS